jgi:hypothetical protein
MATFPRAWKDNYLRSWALLEEPPIVRPLKNFPAFYETIAPSLLSLPYKLNWTVNPQLTGSPQLSLSWTLCTDWREDTVPNTKSIVVETCLQIICCLRVCCGRYLATVPVYRVTAHTKSIIVETCLQIRCLEPGCITLLFICCLRVCCGRYLATVPVYRVNAQQIVYIP